ncbi:MAG: CHC2 zinc finger domain-containing protein [Candidatus Gracilibacteria bacterium]|nr:CHC2 zinc finger domain-containing protein [Candidatus Gracilibacteria bacterium]
MNAVMQTLPEVTKEKHYLRRGIILSDFLKQEILARINLIDIIKECLPLKKKGNYFLALCPFHSENTPSFALRPHWQSYKCFGCGDHGDVIDFIMKFKSINYAEAIIYLSKRIPGLHVHYGNLYREDYFTKLKYYENGGKTDPEIPTEVYIADTIDEYIHFDTERTFAYYKKCVDVILEAQSNRHAKFYGKKVSEVLGYEPDVFAKQNAELQFLSEEACI